MIGNNLSDGEAAVRVHLRLLRFPWYKKTVSALQGDTAGASCSASMSDTSDTAIWNQRNAGGHRQVPAKGDA
jgi:hypothetical protein